MRGISFNLVWIACLLPSGGFPHYIVIYLLGIQVEIPNGPEMLAGMAVYEPLIERCTNLHMAEMRTYPLIRAV